MSARASAHNGVCSAVTTTPCEMSLFKVDLQRKVGLQSSSWNTIMYIFLLHRYSFYTDIPSELYWQRLQSWSGGTEDGSQPQGQMGETVVC